MSWKNYKKKERFVKFYAYSDKHRDPNYLYVWKVISLAEAERMAKKFRANGQVYWYDGTMYKF